MRLVLKNVVILFLAYAILIIGVGYWLGASRLRSESDLIEEALTLVGREKAVALDQAIRDAQQPTNLLGDAPLRHGIETILATSEIVKAVTVVDADGRVLASDLLPAGAQLSRPSAVFRNMKKPEAFAEPRKRLNREAQYVLYLPLEQRPGALTGYLQITFESPRIKEVAHALNTRLIRDAVIGLALLAVTAITLHLQLTRHAQRLTQFLNSLSTDARAKISKEGDEFAVVYQAAEKVGSALSEARRQGEGAERRVGQLSDVLRVGLVWCQPDKQVEFANRRALELSGAETFEAFRADWDRIAAPVREVMDALHGSGMNRSRPVDVQMGIPPRNVRILVYRIGATDCEGFAALITDPEIIESLEEDVSLATQMRALSPMLRTVAHELRSPLAAMMVNIDLLRHSLGDEAAADPGVLDERNRYLGIVHMEMKRLNETLVEMLDHVAPSQRPKRVELGPLLRDLATLIQEQARRQNVELHTDIPNTPILVLGKVDQLKQVFLNVAVNALEAMRDGGRLEIVLSGGLATADVLFRDTGHGLATSVMEKIYEMGYSTKEAGGGMGLYVARTLIEQHGGEIRAESGSGEGTSFRISLPSVA